jgi:hypothetical protein
VGWSKEMEDAANDLLCKIHNPLKRLFGHKKIGNWPITEADTDFC